MPIANATLDFAPPDRYTRRVLVHDLAGKRGGDMHGFEENNRGISGYRNLEYIDEGSFGQVFKAEKEVDRSIVALKRVRLSQRVAKNVLREYDAIKALQGIRHESLLPVNRILLLDKTFRELDQSTVKELRSSVPSGVAPTYIVYEMPLAEKSLSQVLDQYPRGIPVNQLLTYMERIAEALDALNLDAKIQHRDVKPANILLVDEKAVLADFGEVVTGIETDGTQTVGGAPAYMAPEVLLGRTHRHSDQYSFALTYFHLRTGELPVRRSIGQPGIDNIEKIVNPGERQALVKATSLDPDDRYDRCVNFVRELKSSIFGETTCSTVQMKGLTVGSSPIPEFVLIAKLGEGAFGTVWKARRTDGTLRALKWISFSRPDAALMEYRAFREITNKKITHPNILRYENAWLLNDAFEPQDLFALESQLGSQTIANSGPQWGESGEFHFVVELELADGNLSTKLEEHRATGKTGIPIGDLLRYMDESASALRALHQSNIIHRDIKPQNLLLKDNAIKVADFGAAAVLAEQERTATIFRIGTIDYMPPEQFQGRKSMTGDQYSLACTFIHLRTGLSPKRDFVSVNYSHINGPAERAVLERATSEDPSKRFVDAVAFTNQLRAAIKRDSGPNLAWLKKLAAAALMVITIFVMVKYFPTSFSSLPSPPSLPTPTIDEALRYLNEGDAQFAERNQDDALRIWSKAQETLQKISTSSTNHRDEPLDTNVRWVELRVLARLDKRDEFKRRRDDFGIGTGYEDKLDYLDFIVDFRQDRFELDQIPQLKKLCLARENWTDAGWERNVLDESYNQILSDFADHVDGLKERVEKADVWNAVELTALKGAISGQGEIAKLLNDAGTRDTLQQVYDNLDSKHRQHKAILDFEWQLTSCEKSFASAPNWSAKLDEEWFRFLWKTAAQESHAEQPWWKPEWTSRIAILQVVQKMEFASVPERLQAGAIEQAIEQTQRADQILPAHIFLALWLEQASETQKFRFHGVTDTISDARRFQFPPNPNYRAVAEYALWIASNKENSEYLKNTCTHFKPETTFFTESRRMVIRQHLIDKTESLRLDDPFPTLRPANMALNKELYDLLNVARSPVGFKDSDKLHDAWVVAGVLAGEVEIPPDFEPSTPASVMSCGQYFSKKFKEDGNEDHRKKALKHFATLVTERFDRIGNNADWITQVFNRVFGQGGLRPIDLNAPGVESQKSESSDELNSLFSTVLRIAYSLNEQDLLAILGPNDDSVYPDPQTRIRYLLHRFNVQLTDSASSRLIQAEMLWAIIRHSSSIKNNSSDDVARQVDELELLLNEKCEPASLQNALLGELNASKAHYQFKSNPRSLSQQKDFWQESIRAFTEALKANDIPKEWYWYARLSDTHKHFAIMTLQSSKSELEAQLILARDTAKEAIRLSNSEPYALVMLADAHEDLARYAIKEQQTNYETAIEFYDQARNSPRVEPNVKRLALRGFARTQAQLSMLIAQENAKKYTKEHAVAVDVHDSASQQAALESLVRTYGQFVDDFSIVASRQNREMQTNLQDYLKEDADLSKGIRDFFETSQELVGQLKNEKIGNANAVSEKIGQLSGELFP